MLDPNMLKCSSSNPSSKQKVITGSLSSFVSKYPFVSMTEISASKRYLCIHIPTNIKAAIRHKTLNVYCRAFQLDIFKINQFVDTPKKSFIYVYDAAYGSNRKWHVVYHRQQFEYLCVVRNVCLDKTMFIVLQL